jgi:hypothetical protein
VYRQHQKRHLKLKKVPQQLRLYRSQGGGCLLRKDCEMSWICIRRRPFAR